jgi:hypothetical protein
VLANDTAADVDGDTLELLDVSIDPSQGVATIVDGQVSYTPPPTFLGSAEISYVVTDGTESTDTGLLTVTVGDTVTPVITSLDVALGGGSVDGKTPLKVSWAASDAGGSGLARFEVQVSKDGGAFTAFSTGTATSRTAFFLAYHQYRFRVRAIDGDGNVSAYLLKATRSPVLVQSGNTAVVYRATPWTYVGASAASGTGYRHTSTKGASAAYAFSGREIAWVAPKNARSGTALVYIDGVKVATVNLYSATARNGQQVFRKVFPTFGRHTIKVVAASTGKRVNLDAFIVLR